jgi:hypothetical protein
MAPQPICLMCGALMRIVWIAANNQDPDRNTFECHACKIDFDILLVRNPL